MSASLNSGAHCSITSAHAMLRSSLRCVDDVINNLTTVLSCRSRQRVNMTQRHISPHMRFFCCCSFLCLQIRFSISSLFLIDFNRCIGRRSRTSLVIQSEQHCAHRKCVVRFLLFGRCFGDFCRSFCSCCNVTASMTMNNLSSRASTCWRKRRRCIRCRSRSRRSDASAPPSTSCLPTATINNGPRFVLLSFTLIVSSTHCCLTLGGGC